MTGLLRSAGRALLRRAPPHFRFRRKQSAMTQRLGSTRTNTDAVRRLANGFLSPHIAKQLPLIKQQLGRDLIRSGLSAMPFTVIPPILSNKFYPCLFLYHLLPLHFPLTLFGFDAPFGRFNKSKSILNFNGNLGWFLMEIVAPATFLGTLAQTTVGLSRTSSLLAGLYVSHYFHRAVISPLILSPSRSKQHVIVTLAAGFYNLLNGFCLATGLAYFPLAISGVPLYACVAGWAVGFIGNIYHDEILNDLRRSPSDRLVSNTDEKVMAKDKEAGKGRYAIPRGGLFTFVSLPNYLCEWFEWTCFALAAAPSFFITTPPPSSLPPLIQTLLRGFWPTKLLHPAWMFVIFLLASMTPRAVRSHRWYQKTFGERYPKDRKIVVPFIF